MQVKEVAVVCLVLAVVVAAMGGDEGRLEEENSGSEVKRNSGDRLEAERRGARLFAFATTTSIKRLATTTITAISTCLSILAMAPSCTGRRKRAMFNDLV